MNLEVTVEANAALDVSEFDVSRHAGLLPDGVGDADMLAVNREALQGRAKANNNTRDKHKKRGRGIPTAFDEETTPLKIQNQKRGRGFPRGFLSFRKGFPRGFPGVSEGFRGFPAF